MSDAKLRALIEERNLAKRKLAVAEQHLSAALTEWSREHGYLVKLTAEQALREMRVPA